MNEETKAFIQELTDLKLKLEHFRHRYRSAVFNAELDEQEILHIEIVDVKKRIHKIEKTIGERIGGLK